MDVVSAEIDVVVFGEADFGRLPILLSVVLGSLRKSLVLYVNVLATLCLPLHLLVCGGPWQRRHPPCPTGVGGSMQSWQSGALGGTS